MPGKHQVRQLSICKWLARRFLARTLGTVRVLDAVSVSTLLHGAAVYSVSHGISNKGDSSTYDWLIYCWGDFITRLLLAFLLSYLVSHGVSIRGTQAFMTGL